MDIDNQPFLTKNERNTCSRMEIMVAVGMGCSIATFGIAVGAAISLYKAVQPDKLCEVAQTCVQKSTFNAWKVMSASVDPANWAPVAKEGQDLLTKVEDVSYTVASAPVSYNQRFYCEQQYFEEYCYVIDGCRWSRIDNNCEGDGSYIADHLMVGCPYFWYEDDCVNAKGINNRFCTWNEGQCIDAVPGDVTRVQYEFFTQEVVDEGTTENARRVVTSTSQALGSAYDALKNLQSSSPDVNATLPHFVSFILGTDWASTSKQCQATTEAIRNADLNGLLCKDFFEGEVDVRNCEALATVTALAEIIGVLCGRFETALTKSLASP